MKSWDVSLTKMKLIETFLKFHVNCEKTKAIYVHAEKSERPEYPLSLYIRHLSKRHTPMYHHVKMLSRTHASRVSLFMP